MNEILINVVKITETNLCVSQEDGKKVYEKIKEVIISENIAVISFENADLITSSFLNIAVGQLYNKEFDYELLKKLLKVINMSNNDKKLLQKVIDNAKLYYKNKENYEKILENEE